MLGKVAATCLSFMISVIKSHTRISYLFKTILYSVKGSEEGIIELYQYNTFVSEIIILSSTCNIELIIEVWLTWLTHW